jgi:membrane associated rhomboid family serine protease
MIQNLSNELYNFLEQSKQYLLPWLYCIGALWGINILNWVTGSKLNILGIYPRHLIGLVGIVFSPILHQNFTHLFFNTIPLFALGLIILARGLNIFLTVTIIVTVIGGLLVWIAGRRAIHLGASGVVSGYFGFLLATAYTHPSLSSLVLAVLVGYYFGGIFLGLFPQEDKVSWESHLFGFLGGIASAYYLQIAPTKLI